MIKVAYVCNFASPHARGLISSVASIRPEFEITVLSTGPAQPMPGVELISLVDRQPGETLKTGISGRFFYAIVNAFPALYQNIRIGRDIQFAETLASKVAQIAARRSFDVVHGLRTLPEGAIARKLAEATGARFMLSTWGQDFVLWAARHRGARQLTREIVSKASAFFPDNHRDKILAASEFHLSEHAEVMVMPAIGGLDIPALENLKKRSAAVPIHKAGPLILSARGYDNLYVKTSQIIRSLPALIRHYPDLRLVIDGPRNHPGKAPLQKLARRAGVADRIDFVHLNRSELFQFMEHADIYASVTSSDGLPISLMEALYFGAVPVVLRQESLFPPLNEGVNAVSFAEINTRRIVEAFLDALALGSGKSRGSRIRVNREMLETLYNRKENTDRLAGIYEKLADEHENPA